MNKTILAILNGIMAALTVFVTGFGIMYILWNIKEYDSCLLGLFDYRAAYLGDSICLPFLTGLLVTYISFNRIKNNKAKRNGFLVALILAIIATTTQISWLVSAKTKLNWTIPKQHKFNFAGWYHAFFFIIMFAILGFLFTLLIYAKQGESSKKNCYFNKILQTLIWFFGALFLYLVSLDNYATANNYFKVLSIVLIAIFTFIKIIHLITFKSFKSPTYENIAALSSVFSAFALANIIYGGVNTDYTYTVSCALLVVVLLVPNENRIKKMITFYFWIAIPAIMLELAISSQKSIEHSLIMLLLTIIIPCTISLGQNDIIKKILSIEIYSGMIILLGISALVILFVYKNSNLETSLLEKIVNIIFVCAIPNYIRKTFPTIIDSENDKAKTVEDVTKKQKIMYLLYAIIVLGGLILIMKIYFRPINFINPKEFILHKLFYLGISVLLISILLLIIIVYQKISNNKAYNILAILFICTSYCALFLTILNLGSYKIINMQLSMFDYLTIPALIFFPLIISLGFINNISKLRGSHPNSYMIFTAIIIYIGTFSVILVSELQMIINKTYISIIINILCITISAILLPSLITLVLAKETIGIQLTKNTPVLGVFQDGFLYSLAILLSELASVIFLFNNNYENVYTYIINLILTLIGLSYIINWPLDFCISNNLQHYLDRKKEIDSLENYDEKSALAKQLKELKNHLTAQNIIAIIIAFPYSIFTILKITKEAYEKNIDIKYKFIPK